MNNQREDAVPNTTTGPLPGSPGTTERNGKRGKASRRTNDSRCAGKPCSVCAVQTIMGVYENAPSNSRERWNGTEYVRFCGPECEDRINHYQGEKHD